MSDRGTLLTNEPHPAVESARAWYEKNISFLDQFTWLEAFASNAIEGNRLAEICCETLNRLMKGEPVSDRYFLGLCWTMRGWLEDLRNMPTPQDKTQDD